jgi:tetratricopeptide (TPR) repeat protein
MKKRTQPISSKKKRIFWIVMLSLPVAVLLIAEIVLRVMNYGGNLDLITTKRMVGKEYYTVNHDVARRYFTQKGLAIPEPHDDLFDIVKRPGTKRIFMLGESTMAGFPYDYNATAPFLLRDRLERLLPQYHIEIVNFALSAVNSYTVLDMIRELAPYKPDAYIVYVGHNEFYGALGVGSTESLGSSRLIIRSSLALKNIRIYRLLRDAEEWVAGLFRHRSASADATLMEAMVGSKTIPYGGDDYRRARDNFEANIGDIISIARDQRIPIIFSTLTSNIRDQEPFQPVFSPETDRQHRDACAALLQKGEAELRLGKWQDLRQTADEAIRIDSLHAGANFLKAKALDKMGAPREAKRWYERARDLDALRFRASGEFNDILRKICASTGVPVADADSAFDAASPDGIVGKNLMLEHLHPTYDGYFLLAKTFFNTIAAHTLLAGENEWRRDREWTDAQYKDSSGVTGIELESARYMIGSLTSRWPFTQNTQTSYTYIPADKTGEVVMRFMQKKITWSQAHYELGDWFRDRGDYRGAIREYNAIAKVQPYYYLPVMLIGDMYRGATDDKGAEAAYRRAIAIQDSPFLHVRLGILNYDRDSLSTATEEFEKAFALEMKGNETMSKRDRAMAYYFLGVTYGKRGMLDRAKVNLQTALQLDPGNNEVKALLARMR